MDVRDVRMIERRERLGFAREPREAREAIGVVGEQVRQDFERNLAIELRLTCPVHLAHATFADLGGDLIRTEAVPAVRGTAGFG